MLGSNPSADSVASTDSGGCCGIPLSAVCRQKARIGRGTKALNPGGVGAKPPQAAPAPRLPSDARALSHNALMNRGLAAEPRFISVLSLVFSNVSDFP
jgi:hypothetical protein